VSVFKIDFGAMGWQGRRDGARDKTYGSGKPGGAVLRIEPAEK
jgi:hypothetical protein